MGVLDDIYQTQNASAPAADDGSASQDPDQQQIQQQLLTPMLRRRGAAANPGVAMVPSQPTSPALSAPTYPDAPRSTPAGADYDNPSPADGASAFNKIFGQEMTDYTNKQNFATDLQSSPPVVKPSKTRMVLGTLAGALTGWGEGATRGVAVASRAINAPQEQATTRWQSQVDAAKGDVSDTLNKIKMTMDAQKGQVDAQEANNRTKQIGIDSQRTQAEIAHWDQQDRISQQDANDPWKNISGTDRMLVVSKEVGPDGKPTQRATEAAAAYKQFYDDEIKKVQAAYSTRNPDEFVKTLETHISNLQTQQQHFEQERTRLETSNAAQLNQDDPGFQKQMKDLNDSISQIDSEVADARQLAKGKLEIKDGSATGPGASNAPAAGAGATQGQPPSPPQGAKSVIKDGKGNVTGYRMQDGSIKNPDGSVRQPAATAVK